MRTLKIARFIILYQLTDPVRKIQIKFEKKKPFLSHYDDSNANFENSLKQEITNLANCYFAIFSSFKKLIWALKS